ncbi:MAG TPA: type II toxin-antitoxin system VapC family toxin [Solirubrobacterales bacterium]|nr:type II toxin-antitoxin system VapC family toxin [Solirubrobacterales bacterium]
MSEAVLDASVVLKWFHSEGEGKVEAARELRGRYESGELYVLAPPLLWLELINVAARSWRWSGKQLDLLAATLPQLGFEIVQPGLPRLASWAAGGLTAYDAAYVTVAEEAGVDLITDDAGILQVAPEIAIALSG